MLCRSLISIIASHGFCLHLFSIHCTGAHPTQGAAGVQVGEPPQDALNLTTPSFANLEQPPSSLRIDVKYVQNGVYFSEKDFYLTIIYAIADEATDDISRVETHTRWPSFSSIGLEFRAIRDVHGFPFLDIKSTLEIIELFARTLSTGENRLAEAFFYPKWNGRALGVGRLFHRPDAIAEPFEISSPSNVSNTVSLSVGINSFDLSVRLHYNPNARQNPRKVVFWFIIEGLLEMARLPSHAPCRNLRRHAMGLSLGIKPERSTRGLFINGIVIHVYKAIAIAMAQASEHGWYGDVGFYILRDGVHVATGSMVSGNTEGAVGSANSEAS